MAGWRASHSPLVTPYQNPYLEWNAATSWMLGFHAFKHGAHYLDLSEMQVSLRVLGSTKKAVLDELRTARCLTL